MPLAAGAAAYLPYTLQNIAFLNPLNFTPTMSNTTSQRTVFFVSDGTGITAETFGNSILAQFAQPFRRVRLPFVSDAEKAQQAVAQINDSAHCEAGRPIVFTTLVNPEAARIVHEQAQALVFDTIATFVAPLEQELGATSNHRVGRFSDISQSKAYNKRIEAINFSLAHDDGQSIQDLNSADIILVGVSRSGKTPTSLYLAMQYGLKVSNYPLVPDDFERQQLPAALLPHQNKLFGLSIRPERLSEIRAERRPNSKYADLANCRYEVAEAEAMMRRAGVRWLSTTTKSIEEIATTILQAIQPGRLDY